MDRKKRLKHLLAALEQVIQMSEQGGVEADLAILKSCYADASNMLELDQDVSGEVLRELSLRVRTAIRPGMLGRGTDVDTIALGFKMLSQVA